MNNRWDVDRAWEWYNNHPWIAGCNFIPSTAVNQLEMWQEETFDPETIERELSWASELGMNTIRVYLHDLAWEQDSEGFFQRVDRFLHIAGSQGIKSIPVIFDDCWHEGAEPGLQPEPVPGVHNSRWLQSPGKSKATDTSHWPVLEQFVKDVVTRYGQDQRVLMWDIYNELGNFFLPTLSLPWHRRIPKLLVQFPAFHLMPTPTLPLFRKTLQWVRECSPVQPVTASIYMPHRNNREVLKSSDIITFHNYKDFQNLEQEIIRLKQYDRPIICTEFMSRTSGSTFKDCLPVFKKHNVGWINWGLVSGKTQTIYSWADRGNSTEPATWFHDILRKDGTPYDPDEAAFIRNMTVQGP